MTKRFYSILLILSMMLSLVPVIVSADDGDKEPPIDFDQAQIYIGDSRVSNNRLSGEGWYFEKETNTLVLKNFSIGGTSFAYTMGEKWEDTYEIAYIHVGGSGVNLKIRSEGDENWIGGYECMGKPSTVIYNRWGWPFQYISYGIYNPKGTVTISGSAPLNIYTNVLGIEAKNIYFESDTNVTVKCYSNSIHADGIMHLAENSFVEAHAYAADDSTNVAATYAAKGTDITVSKNAHIFAEIERLDPPVTIGPIYALCSIGNIDVLGGKITAICRDDGRLGYKGCYNEGIMARFTLNIDEGGEVNAYVYNTSRKNYTGSAAIGGYISPSQEVKFSGSGVIRAGVQMSPPKGTEPFPLFHCTETIYPEHARVTYSDTNNRPKDFDIYQEVTVTASDGIFLRDGGDELQWTYCSDFKSVGSILKPSPDNDMDRIISGGELRPILADYPNAPITVQSGKFYLNTSSDDGKALTPGTVEIRKGAELVILGGGKIDGLNVIGEGKITFLGSTVEGKVDKSVAMVVDGGNINVDYEGTATTSGGIPVSRFAYTLMSDETAFEQVTYVTLLDGRDYGSAGLYPFDGGKTVYLWVNKNSDVRHVSANPKDKQYGYTLYPTSSNACLLEERENVKISDRLYYVAVPDQDSEIIPFKEGTDHKKRYNLTWSFSDDGYTWYGIYDTKAIGDNGELKLEKVYDAWCNRMYRCEVRSKEDGENTLLGVYTAMLYIYDPEIRCDGGFVDGKEVTVRFTPTKQPGISACKISSFMWQVSEDGTNFKTLKDFSGKDSCTLTVSDEMDGWVLRCSAFAGELFSEQNRVLVEKTCTINVIEKKVRIEEQPKNEQWIDLEKSDTVSLSVKARYATKYQWQVSKRPYVNSKGYGFEDIPGANSSTYSMIMNTVTNETRNYVYRCVVGNEYGEAISDEVYFFVVEEPCFRGMSSKMTVILGEEASAYVEINSGEPTVANTFYWEVSKDGGSTYVDLATALKDIDYDCRNVEFTYGELRFTSSSSLSIPVTTSDMEGWLFRCTLIAKGKTMQEVFKLTFHEHIWEPATCLKPETCSVEGCGETRGEKLAHSFSEKWSFDGEKHWHLCATDGCDEKDSEEAHIYDNSCDTDCNICGAERKVVHDYKLVITATEHWRECSLCHKVKHQSEHYYDNSCDTKCNYCGYIRKITHSYDEKWTYDENRHWHVCSVCGNSEGELGDHAFTAENAEEKYLKSEATCTGKAVYYKSCICGLSSKGTEQEATFTFGDVLGHSYGEWKSNGDGTHTRICSRASQHTETGNCHGGNATCISKAKCDGCGEYYGNIGEHAFTAESTEEKYLKSEATCTGKAVYYKSCICGLSSKGTEQEATFTFGDVLGHSYGEWRSNGDGTHTRICSRASQHTENGNCHGGNATCISKAKCDDCGEYYGEINPEKHLNLIHIEAEAATETDKGNIEYWYCDDCGKYFTDALGTKEISKEETVTDKLNVTPSDTGDSFNLKLWIAILFASGAAVIVAKKKKQF